MYVSTISLSLFSDSLINYLINSLTDSLINPAHYNLTNSLSLCGQISAGRVHSAACDYKVFADKDNNLQLLQTVGEPVEVPATRQLLRNAKTTVQCRQRLVLLNHVTLAVFNSWRLFSLLPEVSGELRVGVARGGLARGGEGRGGDFVYVEERRGEKKIAKRWKRRR